MKDQQGLAQIPDDIIHHMFAEVIQKLFFDLERASGQGNRSLPLFFNFIHFFRHVPLNILRIAGRADCGNRLNRSDPAGSLKNRCSPERMAHEDGRGFPLLFHECGRRNKVVDIGREHAVGKIPLTLAQTGKIEPEHPDIPVSERTADMADRVQVFAAGETVGEQNRRAAFAGIGQIHPRRQHMTLRTFECDVFTFHTFGL